MSATSQIIGALFYFASAVVGTPLITRQDQLLSTPANLTLDVISHSDRVAPATQLQGDGLYLAVTYDNLVASSDVTGRSNDHYSTVKLKVGFPEGYMFEIHDPRFQANVSVAEHAVAEFILYTSFGDAPVTISGSDVDAVEIYGPDTGVHVIAQPTTTNRKWRSPCGGANTTLSVTTRVKALGGIPDPYPASASIQYSTTTMLLYWMACTV